MKEPKDRPYQVVIDEIEAEIDASQFVVSVNIIDKICNGDHLIVDDLQDEQVPKACDGINLHLGRVSSVLIDSWLAQQVEERMNLGRDQIAIGSTVGMKPDEVLNHDADDSDLDKQSSEESILKTQMQQTKHKYGIEIPTSIEHAKELNQKDGSDFWMKVLAQEMYNIGVEIEILAKGQPAPIGWHKVMGHFVWDVKMDFTHKAQWVLDGHKTLDAEASTYAGVVSRESIRIVFLYAALNGLDIFSDNIRKERLCDMRG